MWMRGITIVLGAAVIGGTLASFGLQIASHGGWFVADVSALVVLGASTLLFTVPGSMMMSLLYAGIRGRGFSTSLSYLILMFAGSGFGALWLFKLFGTFNTSMIGCGYGAATAGAWILLHHLIESQKRRDIVAERNGLPLLPSLDRTTTVTWGLVNKLRDELP